MWLPGEADRAPLQGQLIVREQNSDMAKLVS